MLKLKVCGMLDTQNIKELLNIKPDFMGFIFYEKSKRFVGNNLNRELLLSFPKSTKKVGVFVNAELNTIFEKVKEFELDFVQLHGEETPEYCENLQQKNINIIKAFSLDENFDFNQLINYKHCCDYFLFDTKGTEKGGNGITFNWQILENYTIAKPFFLAGGIDGNNLNSLIALSKKLEIYAVDINSKFEIEPGFKNIQKVKEFKNNLN